MKDLAGSLAAARRQHAEGTVKTAEDLDRYRQIIDKVKPALIVETGTFSGRSAIWFARTAHCPVVTVDVHPQVDRDTMLEARTLPIRFFTGSSTRPDLIDRIHSLARAVDGPVIVSLDSDHSAGHVTAELAAYAPLVTAGSYCVVEDGLLRWMDPAEQAFYIGNPLDAVESWLPGHPDFQPDVELEDLYPTTQFPSGWLRRAG